MLYEVITPLACSVALTVIEEVVDGGILAEVDKKSEYFCSKIEKLMARHKSIEKINGMGLLLGVKLSGVESKDVITSYSIHYTKLYDIPRPE